MSSIIPLHFPGCAIGVIGGGQLGRMLALAARRLGVRVVVWTGGLEAPAVEVANEVIDRGFDDPEAMRDFCERVTVATVEFENIPYQTLSQVASLVPVHPSPHAISICQNREREKKFLREHQIPHAANWVVANAAELTQAMRELGGAGVLKTADFGYDGKGQIKLRGDENPAEIWQKFDSARGVLEAWVPFIKELSIIVARGADGQMVTFDVAENRHREHILDVSIVPASVAQEIAEQAASMASRIALALDYRGVFGVEFFLKADGELLVNEIAPRPHNSGHHTLDACVTCQFEQQLRAVLGMPLGSTRLMSPVVMLNLLGDFWPEETTPPDWALLLADGETKLHLYGKRHARGRRKMGHANFLGTTVEDALERAEAFKASCLQK
ncbi:MAG: 5-(carboxyamino)imidazole ribonucleotide synthase [Verrucomicrobia bacterium]|nr:MAG: 5-(carboxyamino)imidazole ribonucleotide synthase [Verrucomicrobiota bacterium]